MNAQPFRVCVQSIRILKSFTLLTTKNLKLKIPDLVPRIQIFFSKVEDISFKRV